jgi:hypothetical protein
MKLKSEIKPVEVFTGTLIEAEMVKSLLENAEIETFLKDENVGYMAPWNVASGGLGAVKVVVSSADQDNAKEVVAEYKYNTRSNG